MTQHFNQNVVSIGKNIFDDDLMTLTALARRAVWTILFKTDTFRRFISLFVLKNFTQKFVFTGTVCTIDKYFSMSGTKSYKFRHFASPYH